MPVSYLLVVVGNSWCFLAWMCITPVYACASHCLSLCVSNIPLPFSLWYLPLDLALTLNLGWSHFKIFMSAKTLCPNKTTFRVSEGLGCRHIFGGPLFTTVVLDVIPFPPMPMPGQKKKEVREGWRELSIWAEISDKEQFMDIVSYDSHLQSPGRTHKKHQGPISG